MAKHSLTPIASALGLTLAATFAGTAQAETSPFGISEISSGYEVAEAGTEGKCGEGKCGGKKAEKEGKCGEGKCGADKAAEGKCGGDKAMKEGKCGGDKAEKEGKCGEGKCGGSK
jgi:uncharacterized low-complexity protein